MQYSFTKGLSKGLMSVLIVASSLLALVGFSDVSVWGLLEQYLKPVIGSLTVGGLLAMFINYIKVRSAVSTS